MLHSREYRYDHSVLIASNNYRNNTHINFNFLRTKAVAPIFHRIDKIFSFTGIVENFTKNFNIRITDGSIEND